MLVPVVDIDDSEKRRQQEILVRIITDQGVIVEYTYTDIMKNVPLSYYADSGDDNNYENLELKVVSA